VRCDGTPTAAVVAWRAVVACVGVVVLRRRAVLIGVIAVVAGYVDLDARQGHLDVRQRRGIGRRVGELDGHGGAAASDEDERSEVEGGSGSHLSRVWVDRGAFSDSSDPGFCWRAKIVPA
jgi:hypothetical protein